MSTPLRNGHAAWVWLDLNGHGKRWHLAVPVASDEFGSDDETQALFPLSDDYRMEIDEFDDCVQRQVSYPSTEPTAAELADAAERAAEDRA